MGYMKRDELKALGEDAIRRVIGDDFTDMDADVGPDFEGRGAYLFTIRFSTEETWRRASALQAKMSGAIIDALHHRGDEHFPFIRIMSDGSWTFRCDAAAE